MHFDVDARSGWIVTYLNIRVLVCIIMDEQIVLSFRQHIEFMAADQNKQTHKCAARLKNGICKINATCGRFCKKHQHLENNIKYMIRPGAGCNVVYHDHPPHMLCDHGCPRFDAIVCT